MTKNGPASNGTSREQNHPLKRSILTHMVIIPFIPFLLAVGVSFYYFATTLERNTISSLKRIVADHCDMIDAFLMERQADLELITNTYTFDEILAPPAIEVIFEHLKQRSGAFVDLGLFDAAGIHRRYVGEFPRLQGKGYKDEPWFKKVMAHGYYISDVFTGYRRIPHFVIAVKKERGDAVWVLRATIDTLAFERRVSRVRMGRTGESYILNTDGILQTQRRSGGIEIMGKDPEYDDFPIQQSRSDLPASAQGEAPGDTIQTFIKSDGDGDAYLYATTWLKNKAWRLVVRQEKKDAYRSLYTAMYIILMIMVVGGAVIVVTAIYMTEHILRRMETLGMEKEHLGNQLIRAVQLAEIGEMAAGFAHEINNPLQIIKGEQMLIETLFGDVPATAIDQEIREEIEESMDQIKLQVSRCSEITHAILKFGRKNDTRLTRLDPVEIIPEMIHMVEKKAQVDGIAITTEIAPDTPGFEGDASQFQQVMLNLLNNAMDAVVQRHGTAGGTLGITSLKDESGNARIMVADNGVGITPENMEKVFSPFFTTKPVGKGTGLGLSVCYGIIKAFGGEMAVETQREKGTTFIITLPPCTDK